MIQKLISFLRGALPQQQPAFAPVNVILTGQGLMLSQAWPDGRFQSKAVDLHFGDAAAAAGAWAVGRPINLAIEDEPGGSAKLLLEAGGEGAGTLLFDGPRASVEQAARSVQQAWLDANAGVFPGVPAAAGVPPAQWGQNSRESYPRSAAGAAAPAYYPGARFGEPQRSVMKKWMVLLLAACVLVGGGWAAANYYLKPAGPSLDLSSMSIEEVAALDANPAAVRNVQESLIEAVGVGRAQAAQNNAKIEQDHIDALKAMGLQPGVSMKNAMSCLAK